MISFRFHIVSITAVFLALAIGVVVGTVGIDRVVVDNLETRVDRVSKNLDARKAENDALSDEVHDLRGLAGASAPFTVSGRLTDVPLVLVAVRGASGDAADQAIALARKAGASVPGVAWLEKKWTLADAADRSALASAAGVSPQGSNAKVRSAALSAVVGALSPQLPGTDATLAPALLDRLVRGGFLTVDPQGSGAPSLSSMAGRSPRLLLVTGTDAPSDLAAVLVQLARTGAGANLWTVLADAYAQHDGGPKRGAALGQLTDDGLRKQIALVDDLELPEGQAAALLALAGAGASQGRHYGYGSGSDGVLPAWSGP